MRVEGYRKEIAGKAFLVAAIYLAWQLPNLISNKLNRLGWELVWKCFQSIVYPDSLLLNR
jgi:hypothetical protein